MAVERASDGVRIYPVVVISRAVTKEKIGIFHESRSDFMLKVFVILINDELIDMLIVITVPQWAAHTGAWCRAVGTQMYAEGLMLTDNPCCWQSGRSNIKPGVPAAC
jgi:hypothetical protein